jgi:two-component system NtrC family sensor kinase
MGAPDSGVTIPADKPLSGGLPRSVRPTAFALVRDVALPQLRLPFRDLSYRYKIPLSVSFVILATALVISTALAVQAYHDVRREMIAGAESLGKTLARTLAPIMLRDEMWSAYEMIVTPFEGEPAQDSRGKVTVVLNSENQIYVSSHPSVFPTLQSLAAAGAEYAGLAARLTSASPKVPTVLEGVVPGHLVVAVPILSDDLTLLGRVLVLYSESLLLQRIEATLLQVLVSTLAVLAVLLPIGWFAGNRIVEPLVRLAALFGKATREPSPRIAQDLYTGGDEIGQLGRQFQAMLHELEQKQALERQIIATSRLASIGRLAAGIAHEINNPLGGMLNAINTCKRHGDADPVTVRTISLVERGLVQIKETIAALLVEAKIETHALTRDDLEDVQALVIPEAQKKRLAVRWNNDIEGFLPLPSTHVRQVLINLLLNAVQAAMESGYVACAVRAEVGHLMIEVANDGKPLSPGQLEHLFEPFSSDAGTGLGLWVVYQITHQLRGEIRVTNGPPLTRFQVRIPLEEA